MSSVWRRFTIALWLTGTALWLTGAALAAPAISAAPALPTASHYAELVRAGKAAAQHELHEDAAALWQTAAPQLSQLSLSERAQWWLARADLLQFQHQFEAALDALQQVQETDTFATSRALMAARIHLAQDNLTAAQNECRALFGQAQSDVVATCLLEVQGRSGKVAESYQALAKIAARNREDLSDIGIWRREILAEFAASLGRYDEALSWLSFAPLSQQSEAIQKQRLSFLIPAGKAEQVLALMGQCPAPAVVLSDSILVRIAHAEAVLNQRQCWRQLVAERMRIRVLRDDEVHAADVAYYFVHVNPQQALAKRWAERNLTIAQEPADKALLRAAMELSQ